MHVHCMKIEAFKEKKKGISTKTEIQLNWIILIMRLSTNFAKCFSFLILNIPVRLHKFGKGFLKRRLFD